MFTKDRIDITTDVCIIGGGSGGFAAAAAASERGANVIIVEKEPILGGTSTSAGINCYEPGIANRHYDLMLHEQLSKIPGATFIGKSTKDYSVDKPWGLSEADEQAVYTDSLRRSGLESSKWRRMHFEPNLLANAMENHLLHTGKVKILYNCSFLSVAVSGNRINEVQVVSQKEGTCIHIKAKVFIDSSGSIILARASGCQYTTGQESRDAYGEESAPTKSNTKVNGVTLVARVTPVDEKYVDNLPDWVRGSDAEEWFDETRAVAINKYPDGDLNLNILPVMDGEEFLHASYEENYQICKARVYRQWNWLQQEKGFSGYRLKYFASLLGIREDYRLIGKYVLKESDITAGYQDQNKMNETVAFSDHAFDTHSQNSKIKEVDIPYGVPYDCLLTKEVENLMVACRGASFSHIAASSCRLSRTMMALGEAAGTAAAMSVKDHKTVHEINIHHLRSQLCIEQTLKYIYDSWKLNS